MLKNFVLSMVAMVALATVAMAADDFSDVAGLKADSISDAQISIGGANDLNLDVDGLASQATGGKSDKAIEACFRSFGYGGCGYNYGCYNYGCYNYGCYNYSPCYSYCYQPSYYCYRPVCYSYSTCYSPCYSSYWGCY
jgi:hypothetical protein